MRFTHNFVCEHIWFGMAMCNYGIRILWDLNTKQNLYEKVMAVFRFLRVHFSRIWEILTESVSDLNLEYEVGILKVKLYVADERTSLRLSRGIC